MSNTMVKSVFRYLHLLRSYKHLQVACLPLHKVLKVGPLLRQASVQPIHPIAHYPDKNVRCYFFTDCTNPFFQMTNIADLLMLCDLQRVVRDLCPILYKQLSCSIYWYFYVADKVQGNMMNLFFLGSWLRASYYNTVEAAYYNRG
jgi:hypothetical protein